MEEHTLKVLEYARIIEKLQSYASSLYGKEIIAGLQPAYDLHYIEERLKEVTEAVKMLDAEPNIPFGGIRDIRDIMKRAEKGMVLAGSELLDVSSTLFSARRLRNFFMEIADNHRKTTNPYPRILKLGAEIQAFRPLEEAINQSIDNSGEVMDNASPKLKRIRNEMRTVSSRVREKLDSIIGNSSYQKMIQDSIVTIRGDRYVIPIKSEYRGSFDGIIHDRSSSGATLFIEPMAVVQLNNQLRQLTAEEEDEVYRILKELTERVAQEYNGVTLTIRVLAELDFIFARAFYSEAIDGTEPILNEKGLVKLKQARHPLLKVKPVPIDVRLGDGFNTLIITGPNTGGKTVTLKTVGLLTLMMQSGLHVPATPGSEMSIFKGIYCDIGDEQSIEQSLSTFSAHMTQIIKILDKAGPKDMVLLDELGAGTDPAEGAALAMSILDYLHKRDVLTIATTHYSELKSYAYTEEGVENASVEFDLETLSPTYRLIMGIPGRSNALEIALRLGLPKSIVDLARGGITEEEATVDRMIKDIEENNRRSVKERLETQRLKREMEEMKKEYEDRLKRIEEQREKVIADAVEQAKRILDNTKSEADEIIKKVRNASLNELERVNTEVKAKIRENSDEVAKNLRQVKEQSRPIHKVPDKLTPGDQVKIVSLNQKGTVLEVLNDREFVIQAGIMKVTVNKADLEKILQPEEKDNKFRLTKITQSKAKNISMTLDLRGARYEEARERTDKYLDDAYLAGLKCVEIIHGKGTGALREGIHDLLRYHHHVGEFRLGNEGEGGHGVTIVTLRS